MFRGKYSLLKNVIYFAILALHSLFYLVSLYYTWFNSLVFILSLSSSISLISLALYSYLISKVYFYQFYIAIILSSIPLAFLFEYGAILIVPELIIFLILFLRGTEQSVKYLQTRVNKKANLFQHDPAIVRFRGPVPLNLGLQMDIIWNPNGTIPIEGEIKPSDKNISSITVSFILAATYFFCSVIAVSNYYNLRF